MLLLFRIETTGAFFNGKLKMENCGQPHCVRLFINVESGKWNGECRKHCVLDFILVYSDLIIIFWQRVKFGFARTNTNPTRRRRVPQLSIINCQLSIINTIQLAAGEFIHSTFHFPHSTFNKRSFSSLLYFKVQRLCVSYLRMKSVTVRP